MSYVYVKSRPFNHSSLDFNREKRKMSGFVFILELCSASDPCNWIQGMQPTYWLQGFL
jgi:hypothetical protein